MLLASPTERGALIAELAHYYGTTQHPWRRMETATLQRAWRVASLHQQWKAPRPEHHNTHDHANT
jgi:hypothetical protein